MGGSAVAAILALPAVAGHFGVRGGGYTMSNSSAWGLAAAGDDPEPETRAVNMNELGDVLDVKGSGRVAGLFVYNANPLMTVPDQERVRRGLRREDLFTVVHDAVMTDTARYADVVLPATTFLEHWELSRGYGAYSLQFAGPVTPPAGEARPNYDLFAELCRRTGLARPGDPESPRELALMALRTQPDPEAMLARLEAGESLPPPSGLAPVQFVDVFPRTASGRIELVPPELDAEAPAGLYAWQADPAAPERPLALISPALARTISSTFGQLIEAPAAVELHPDDAAARGIADGQAVRVFNDLGEVRCRARINADLRPGVALLPKGLWARHTENGATACALAPATLTDVGAGACFNDARVEVAPLD
jgi:anaerobic selenocysteine-containing dehydrogenase